MPTASAPPRPARASGARRLALVVAAGLVVAAAAVGGLLLLRSGVGPLPDPERCRASVGGEEVSLSTEQAENASLIAAVALRRGLPARAVSIALATAFQESKLVNIDYGDRDSVGLFQQRPSQGWGSRRQVLDPVYATNAFYDALVEVDGYAEMRITEAAQRVQRSAFPEAYEEHAAGARALASALTGYSPHRFWCAVDDDRLDRESVGPSGLTPRAERVRGALEAAFGPQSLGGFEPGGVTTGHMEGSAHYDGRAVDVFVRPISEDNRRRGWALAHWLVANADRLEVRHVIFDAKIWTSGSSSDAGWRDYRAPNAASASPETRAILQHRDHVHVDVAEGD